MHMMEASSLAAMMINGAASVLEVTMMCLIVVVAAPR